MQSGAGLLLAAKFSLVIVAVALAGQRDFAQVSILDAAIRGGGDPARVLVSVARLDRVVLLLALIIIYLGLAVSRALPDALQQRAHPQGACEHADTLDQPRRQRNALSTAPRFALRLRLAGDVDARLPFGRWRRLQRVEEVVHVALEIGERAEASGIDGDEA